MAAEPYYRENLALVHDLGFGFHAERCAPGILALLAPVGERGGLVLELGCGSGLLTRHLVEAGHRVIATDASPAMLALARRAVPDADVRPLSLPGDPLPPADAIVSVGHVLSYLPDAAAAERALLAAAGALRPGGVLAIDLLDLAWGQARREAPDTARVTDDWAIFARYSLPEPDRYVRKITTFVRGQGGCWTRDDEHHNNVLIDTSTLPALLAGHRLDVTVATGFGTEQLPPGLIALIGHRRTATDPEPPR